ncbi:MAG: hypothetical protein PHR35_16525 [Kiritimatiellae bacterium]|nr:hypothetical protein [Kiritimatiellia bacterium]
MNKQKMMVCLCLVLAVAIVASARVTFSTPPPEVTYDGTTFRAERMDDGVVHALDAKTGQLLWQKRLYQVMIDPGLEADVQWIYIRSITESKGRIIVVNGNGTTYLLDPKTREFVVLEPTRKR